MNATKAKSDAQNSVARYLPAIGMLILALFVAWNFYTLFKNSQNEREWIVEATNIKVASQQLAKSASESAAGTLDAFSELRLARDAVQASLIRLSQGAGNLPGLQDNTSEVAAGHLAEIQTTWNDLDVKANNIMQRETLVLDLASAVANFRDAVPKIQTASDQAARRLTQSGAPNQQLFLTTRQMLLADRMLRRVTEMLTGGSGAVSAADNLQRESRLFQDGLNGLLEGNAQLGINRVRNPGALESLREANASFEGVAPSLELILSSSSDLFEVRGAADDILDQSQNLFDQADALTQALPGSTTRTLPSLTAGLAGAGGLVLLFALGLANTVRTERKQAQETVSQNQRNQDAILTLLDEMSTLADGDLTIEATVTEDVTGAIADSVNFAIEQLRDLVTGINDTATAVVASAQQTRTTTTQLAEASGRQADQVRSATDTINNLSRAFDQMANRSLSSNEAAQRSLDIAGKGAAMVRETISGMDTIREQIQETSKRIKRLGESSQEIGDIVELISDIAEQTNILAMNAAIQAASAGGAGRGFAVVADEVQRLSERAANATDRIETLVQTIQTDTAEAVSSMETTTTEVVAGAKLAEDAGQALGRIESESNNLSDLIGEIAKEAQTHSKTASRMAGLMNEIRDISIKTSDGSSQTARAVDHLAQQVRKLSDSVADFKLPAALD